MTPAETPIGEHLSLSTAEFVLSLARDFSQSQNVSAAPALSRCAIDTRRTPPICLAPIPRVEGRPPCQVGTGGGSSAGSRNRGDPPVDAGEGA